MDVGTKLGWQATIIDSIKMVCPTKYDGVEGEYVVCQPRDKQGDMIVTDTGVLYFIPNDTTGKEALLDIT